jgi:hypothetical protein
MNKVSISKLRAQILPIYKDLFAHNTFQNICTFAIQWGKDYPIEKYKGLLFVGKAVNGWLTVDQNMDALFDDQNTNRIFNRSDQIQWVENLSGNTNGYNTRKSAFWRLVKKVAVSHYSHEWYRHIAWTNLYKVAPWEGGNPSESLKQKQQQYSIELLKREIDIMAPEFVIMLTSSWEKPFIEELKKGKQYNYITERKWGKYKSALVEIEGVKYIISQHPQGKSEEDHMVVINYLIEYGRIL